MARTVVRLDEEENITFHKNYNYMWKKLNTVPYYVCGAGNPPQWIKEPWLLPSYANLSKCLSSEYVPSINLVNKIVQFYNANISPQVDTFAFLHETLETGDAVRTTACFADASPYCGIYRGYYYAGLVDKKEVYGAILHIQEAYGEIGVQLLTGISSEDTFRGRQVLELFSQKDASAEEYKKFRDSLGLAGRRLTLYKGHAKLSSGILTMTMQSEDRAGSIIMMHLPLGDDSDSQYYGSIALVNAFSDRIMQILKMGIVRADEKSIKPFSLKDDALKKLLDVDKLPNEHVKLDFQDSDLWNDMIISATE